MQRFYLILLLCIPFFSNAQITQMLKGTIVDKESKQALIGVKVSVLQSNPALETTSDENGYYSIANIPVGKYLIQYSKEGYKEITLADIVFTSAKEVEQDISLEELIKTNKLENTVVKAKRKTNNEMALVSTKAFDVQQTERYAGSRGDPARMASNFAGVGGANDSRNDIVVRGNSPQGLLWRLEDVDIPSPNHFSIPGTTGGPVSIINNKTLSNSDFFTSAFPADYGNAVAGVFDLKFRNGNKDKYEFTAQLGVLGTEFTAEGPLSKKHKASFLVNYRYSTLKLFQGLHIPIGTNSVPNYQDASFKLNTAIGKKTQLSVWGIGGLSNIDIIVSNQTKPPTELYGENDRDQYFKSNMGVVGASLLHNINSTSYIKAVVAYSTSYVNAFHEKVFRDSAYQITGMKPILNYTYIINGLNSHVYYNKKISAKQVVKIGLLNTLYMVNFNDSTRQYPPTLIKWLYRNSYSGNTNLMQAYAQYKYKINNDITLSGGLHSQYLSHTKQFTVEPRISARYIANANTTFNIGYGLHSQMQPMYQYFSQLSDSSIRPLHNYNLGFTKSHHFVISNETKLSKTWGLLLEAYYQYLFQVPIEKNSGSSFNGINQGNSFSRTFPDTLVNKGFGKNMGVEFTLSRAFANHYYLLFTGTVFDSKAQGADKVWRSTDYNGKFILNALGGYEWNIHKANTLVLGTKITYAGGKLYSPPDTAKSNAVADLIVIDSLRNTLQFPNYFRQDIKIGYRINRKKVTHELGLDLVNIYGTKNLLSLTYSPDLAAAGQNPFYKSYQLGFLPLFIYRVDFHR